MVNLSIALLAAVLAAIAEALHAQRLRRVAWLAFGEGGAPHSWTRYVAPARIIGCGALAWGLLTLLRSDLAAVDELEHDFRERQIHHVVIALDVSPSMRLADSGPQAKETRGSRARDALRSVLARLDLRRTRVSVVAFYSQARPVVIDTFDPEVAANVLDDLPLEQAFTVGKTDLYSGVTIAGEIGRAWPAASATLLVVSDGDTLPAKVVPMLPKSFGEVLVLGVGNPREGRFIDGHSSRQDATSLERLALQLSGRYFDVNVRHLPSDVLSAIVPANVPNYAAPGRTRARALIAVTLGASLLAILPLLLAYAGTRHRPPLISASPSRRRSLVLANSGD